MLATFHFKIIFSYTSLWNTKLWELSLLWWSPRYFPALSAWFREHEAHCWWRRTEIDVGRRDSACSVRQMARSLGESKRESSEKRHFFFIVCNVYGLPTTMQALCKICEVVGVLNSSPCLTPNISMSKCLGLRQKGDTWSRVLLSQIPKNVEEALNWIMDRGWKSLVVYIEKPIFPWIQC